MKQSERSVLKEWASVVSAVAAGDQVILVRKGGLADRNFGVASPTFLLMPTFLHQAENRFRDGFAHHLGAIAGADDAAQIELPVFCEVIRSFEVRDLERLLELRDEVIFTEATLRERYAFRPDQALHVIGIRARRLLEPARVENLRRYGGCRSWLTLDQALEFELAPALLSNDALNAALARIEAKLA